MTIYYIANSPLGSDSNNGTSELTPWETITKVNAQTFNPGDIIKFRRGDVFRTTTLTGLIPDPGSAGGGYVTYTHWGDAEDNPMIKKTSLYAAASWTLYGGGVYQATASNSVRAIVDGGYRMARDDGTLYTRDTLPAGWFLQPPSGGGTMYYHPPSGAPGDVEAGNGTNCIYINNTNYVIIDGIDTYGPSRSTNGRHIDIQGTSAYIYVQNLTASHNDGVGIQAGPIDTGTPAISNIYYDNVICWDCSSTGLYNNAITGGIANCKSYYHGKVASDVGDMGGIGCWKGISIVIDGNEVYNIGPDNRDGDFAISVDTPQGSITITRNYIHDTPHGPIQIANGSNHGYLFAYNIIRNWGYCSVDGSSFGKYAAIRIGGGAAGIQNADVWNNTIVNGNNDRGSYYCIGLAVTGFNNSGLTVKNNIFANNECPDVSIESGATITGSDFSNNQYYKSGGYTNNWNYKGSNKSTLAAWQTALSGGGDASGDASPGTATGDPLFMNSSGSLATDYKLQGGSPCINRGVDVGLLTDYGGFSIIGAPEIGAWEYSGAIYSKGDYLSLPSDAADLETYYTPDEMEDVATDDNTTYVSQAGSSQYAIHEFKNDATGKSSCTVTWDGQSTLDNTTDNPTILEIYNTNTEAWEELDRDTSTLANTDFQLSFPIMSGLDNYKDDNGLITCRVYQSGI